MTIAVPRHWRQLRLFAGRLSDMGSEALLIFDGDCGFCSTSAHWIERHWPHGTAEISPWQQLGDEQIRALGIPRDVVATQAWWVDSDGARGGDRAITSALIAASGMWSHLGHVLDAPPMRWFTKPGYQIISRYRYKLPGATPACRI